MPKTTTAGAGTTKQFIDVLTLALPGEFHKTQLGELGNLWTSRVIPRRRCEVLQQLELITAGVHIDEIDNDHAADIAQFQLPCNFDRCLDVGPEHRLPSIGRSGKRAGVHINHGECFRGLDDHVPTRGQIHPGSQCITNRCIDLVVLEQFRGLVMALHHNVSELRAKETPDP